MENLIKNCTFFQKNTLGAYKHILHILLGCSWTPLKPIHALQVKNTWLRASEAKEDFLQVSNFTLQIMPRAVTSSLYHSVRLDQWFSAVTTILDSLENLNENSRNSLEVLWLELGASTATGMIQSLLGKLRSHTAGCMVRQKKINKIHSHPSPGSRKSLESRKSNFNLKSDLKMAGLDNV